MQVKVVRHYCRAQHADGGVKHVAIGEDMCGRYESPGNAHEVRFHQNDFYQVADSNGGDEGNDHCLQIPESPVLKVQYRQHIKGGQADANE